MITEIRQPKRPWMSITLGMLVFGVASCSNGTVSDNTAAEQGNNATNTTTTNTTNSADSDSNQVAVNQQQTPTTSQQTNADTRQNGQNINTTGSASQQQKPAFTQKAIATFDEPWAMCALPQSQGKAQRLLVTEKGGALFVVDTQTGVKNRIQGVPKVAYGGQGGFGDVALAPDFAKTQDIYLSYVEETANKYGAVVIKASIKDLDTTSPKLINQQRIWQQVPKVSGQGHFSHRLLFSPDGQYLYISSGERQKKTPAQDMSVNLGKILRLNPDGSVPEDNPFTDTTSDDSASSSERVTAQIWSLGHRNVLGMQFDDTGRLWANEMGPRGGDELNLIKKGNNYGWPVVSNGRNYSGIDIPDHDTRPDFTPPHVSWTPVISPASMTFYNSGNQQDFPAWQGNMLISGLSSKSLVVISLPTDSSSQAKERYRYNMGERMRSVLAVNGAVWVLEDGNEGRLLQLVPK